MLRARNMVYSFFRAASSHSRHYYLGVGVLTKPQALQTVVRKLRRWVGLPKPRDLTDRQLLERFRAGEESAFAALVDRHGPLVLGICRRVLQHAHDAEDAFQATFLVLARKAGSMPWRDTISNWLHGVALRIARKLR